MGFRKSHRRRFDRSFLAELLDGPRWTAGGASEVLERAKFSTQPVPDRKVTFSISSESMCMHVLNINI